MRLMHDDWQQTDQIVMSVQTAELRHAGIAEKPSLNLSCSLVNIARGQCMLEIFASASGPAASGPTAPAHGEPGEPLGNLVIEIDRPVMRGAIAIPQQLYDSVLACLASAPPRPVSLNPTIGTKLAVSLEGDLRINDVTEVSVIDLSATLPLK